MLTWLNVHWHHNLKNASDHLLNEIILTKEHGTESEKTIVQKAVNTNGFSGHPEMVITCILASRNENTRRDAVSKVLAI